jgi:hypothetical protein
VWDRSMADLSTFDLSQPAEVNWFPAPPLPRIGTTVGKRSFATVLEAIRFVIEELPFYGRQTAFITTETGRLENGDIRLLHSKMS